MEFREIGCNVGGIAWILFKISTNCGLCKGDNELPGPKLTLKVYEITNTQHTSKPAPVEVRGV